MIVTNFERLTEYSYWTTKYILQQFIQKGLTTKNPE